MILTSISYKCFSVQQMQCFRFGMFIQLFIEIYFVYDSQEI